MAWAELTMYVRSGSRASVSGVGTQMMIDIRLIESLEG